MNLLIKLFLKLKIFLIFNTIINLFNINNLEDKNIFLDALKKKYDNIIKNEIGSLTGEQLNIAIKVVANLAIINFIYETENKRFDFMKKRIKKLKKNIIPLIFIEIMKIYVDIDDKENNKKNKLIEEKEENISFENINFQNIKDFIFDEYVKRFNIPLLWVTEPKRLNKRIEKQRGTFLYTNCNDKTYTEILETELYKNIDVFELKFPAKYWDNYFTILNKMNINGKTVYGDLDGLSKQIKMFIQAYSTDSN